MERHTPGIWARTAVDLAHDLAAGFFPGAVTAAWVIQRAVVLFEPVRGAAIVRDAATGLWWVMALALTVSVVTGLIRLQYWKLNVRSGFLESKRQMAVVKHSLFVTIQVAAGVVLATL